MITGDYYYGNERRLPEQEGSEYRRASGSVEKGGGSGQQDEPASTPPPAPGRSRRAGYPETPDASGRSSPECDGYAEQVRQSLIGDSGSGIAARAAPWMLALGALGAMRLTTEVLHDETYQWGDDPSDE